MLIQASDQKRHYHLTGELIVENRWFSYFYASRELILVIISEKSNIKYPDYAEWRNVK